MSRHNEPIPAVIAAAILAAAAAAAWALARSVKPPPASVPLSSVVKEAGPNPMPKDLQTWDAWL